MDKDGTIIKVLDRARRMVHNYASAYRLDAEDLMQELACKLLEVWEKALQKEEIEPYLYGVCRKHLLNFVPREERPLSLDTPIIAESDTTLSDLLEAIDPPRSRADEIRVDIIIQIVHRVLRTCSLEVQIYAVRTFELSSYKYPVNLPKVAYQRAKGSMRETLKRVFRKDKRILSLI